MYCRLTNSKLDWYFFPKTETGVSVLVHAFQGNMKTSLETQHLTCYGKLFQYLRNLLNASMYEACKTENCSYSALQVEISTSTKQHFEVCACHLHISLQGQTCLAPQTKNILLHLYFFLHDVTPQSLPFTPQN